MPLAVYALLLAALMVASLVVNGCDNSNQYTIEGGMLCRTATNTCEVLP